MGFRSLHKLRSRQSGATGHPRLVREPPQAAVGALVLVDVAHRPAESRKRRQATTSRKGS
jgi:hypothetical protein